jgi:hypothetical protein
MRVRTAPGVVATITALPGRRSIGERRHGRLLYLDPHRQLAAPGKGKERAGWKRTDRRVRRSQTFDPARGAGPLRRTCAFRRVSVVQPTRESWPIARMPRH